MSSELSGGAARGGPPIANTERRLLRMRAGVVLALAVALVIGAFAAVTDYVLHRWLHLYSSSIAGAAWLFFGGCWSFASLRRLRFRPPMAERGGVPPTWPVARILAAYRATLPRVAGVSFAVIALAGLADRLRRA